MNTYVEDFKKLGGKYGFPIVEFNGKAVLTAKDTHNEDVHWITYDLEKDTLSFIGNTDNCNIWLCDTRKDFTPEKVVQFVKDLNEIFKLTGENVFTVKELIDPEDWQGIAKVNDAFNDIRYKNN